MCRLLAACKQARCPYDCTPAAVLLEAPPQPPQVCALSRWAAPATQEPVQRFEPGSMRCTAEVPGRTLCTTHSEQSLQLNIPCCKPFFHHSARRWEAPSPDPRSQTAAVSQHLERLPPVGVRLSENRSPAPKPAEQQNTTQPHLPCPRPVRTACVNTATHPAAAAPALGPTAFL